MDDAERLNREYGERSTVEMLRVARIVSVDSGYRWVATAPERTWEYSNGEWTAYEYGDKPSGHEYDEEFFRYLLGEQLWHEGVRSDSPVWDRY